MDDPEYWTTREVAEYLGVAESSVSAYHTTGYMPPPDRQYGRTVLWRPETIREWHANRPRKGGAQ